jgi:hypothetical protein
MTLVDVALVESVTVQVTVAGPAAVGVPEITTSVLTAEVVGVTTRPVAPVMAHAAVYGPVPPVMGRVWVA